MDGCPQRRMLFLVERGGTPGLLENQGPGPRPRQRPQPIGQWCGGPFQNLRRSRGRPTLGQQPRGVPHRSRSLGVDARIIRRRKSLASICHCSRNRSISLTPTIYPSLITEHPNLVPLQIYPTPLRISPWLWFSTTTTRLGWWLHPAFTAGGAASFVGAAHPLVA